MSEPVLPSRRAYLKSQAEAERQSGVRWISEINWKARRRIRTAFDASHNAGGTDFVFRLNGAVNAIYSEGSEAEILQGQTSWLRVDQDENGWEATPTDEYLDWLQAASIALDRFHQEHEGEPIGSEPYEMALHFDPNGFRQRVNDILLDRRIVYAFVDRQLLNRAEEPLHIDVVEPVSNLISSDPRYASAERAYGEALSYLASHQYGPSVTSSASAVQEALKAAGASGSTLGALVKSAKSKKIIRSHDARVLDLIDELNAWLNTDRAVNGNAHWASAAGQADARLAVHLAGAFILHILSGREVAES